MALVDFGVSSSSVVLHPKTPKEMIGLSQTAEGKRKIRVNSSSIAVIQECLRKAKHSLVERWRPESESPATLFGSAIHSALETFYGGQIEERKLPKLETLEMMSFGHAADGEETDLILRAVRSFLTKGQPLTGLPEGDKRSLQNGVWLLHEYFKKFLDDPYIAHSDDNGMFVERQFSLPFYSDAKIEIELFGTIDFVFRNTKTGELIGGDHKTSSSLAFGDSSYFDREKPSHQYTLYAMALHKIFGITNEDFLISIFEVKSRPKTARGSAPSFPRQITKRNQEDFDEVMEVVLDAVYRYLHAIDNNVFPMGSVDVCNKYGGCPYKQVCASPRNLRETILVNKFKRPE